MSNLFVCLLPYLIITFVSILAFIALICYNLLSFFPVDTEVILLPLCFLVVWIVLLIHPIHYCSSCDLYGSVDYCTDCGSYIGPDSCPDCGFECSDIFDYSFCPDCGHSFDK